MNLELFAPEPSDNVLPRDGFVKDYGLILDDQQSEKYLKYFLKRLAWQHDEVIINGQYHQTDRKVAWYGDESYQYRYSGMVKQAQMWNAGLLRLKNHIEHVVGHPFNTCLANLYDHGQQGMSWHSDDEPVFVHEQGLETVIASLSFGATRKFSFKHKTTAEKVDLLLQSGQLIVMRGKTQTYWKHCLPKSTKVLEPRVNLTFRYFFQNKNN